MIRWIICMLMAAGLVAGCGRQESVPGVEGADSAGLSVTSMPPASPRGIVSATDAPPSPVVIAEKADINVTLQQLTQELRDYVVRTRSVPKNFEEFANKSQVRFPAAPEGQKYAIQGQSVVLVKK